jgi:hypothetical protein
MSFLLVREELHFLDRLRDMNLSSELQTGLKNVAISIGSDAGGGGSMNDLMKIVRIDVSKGGKHVVTFLNNLEKDDMYRRWPKKLKQLTMPSWYSDDLLSINSMRIAVLFLLICHC